jgi:hypothetical protein
MTVTAWLKRQQRQEKAWAARERELRSAQLDDGAQARSAPRTAPVDQAQRSAPREQVQRSVPRTASTHSEKREAREARVLADRAHDVSRPDALGRKVAAPPPTKLLAQRGANLWPGCYALHTIGERATGEVFAMGRDPARAVALRLQEEGYPAETQFVIKFDDGRTADITATVRDVLKEVLA